MENPEFFSQKSYLSLTWWTDWDSSSEGIFDIYALTLKHASVGRFRNGVDMRWHFVPLLTPVHLNDVLWVYGEVFVWIYDHTEESWVCLQRQEHKKIILNDFSIKSFMLNNVNFVNEIYDKKKCLFTTFSPHDHDTTQYAIFTISICNIFDRKKIKLKCS